MTFEAPRIDPSDWPGAALLQATLDTLPDPIFVKDRDHRWIAFNAGFCGLVGRTRAELLGRSDPDLFPPEQAAVFWRLDDAVFASGEANENEENLTGADGVVRTLWTRKYPLRGLDGAILGLCGVITDVTELRARMQEAERRETDIKEQTAALTVQRETLDALALPVVELADGVLLMPLVGELSERRATAAMESLLLAIRDRRARTVLLDLTGMPAVDTAVAAGLLRTIRAAGLLGCASVLCGLGPTIASTLVDLDVDLGRVAVWQRPRRPRARARPTTALTPAPRGAAAPA